MMTILLTSWLLLNLQLDLSSLWTDELFTAEWTQLSVPQLIERTAHDFHPPLYFLMVKLWTAIAGRSDFALRWFSVAVGWLSVAALYRLVCHYSQPFWAQRKSSSACSGQTAAVLGASMWALSPVFVLYVRMARYYSLAALFTLVATYALVCALRRNRRASWIAYVAASTAALYTFYLSGLLLIAHGVLVLLAQRRPAVIAWVASVGVIAALLLPWAHVIVRQTIETGSGAADLAFGLSGIALKAAYSAYALAIGESVFPWQPLAVIGVISSAAILVAGVLGWQRRRLAFPLGVLLLLPLLALIVGITSTSPRTPFVSVPARGLFVAPYYALLVAGAANRLRPRVLATLVFAIGIVWSVALWNYYGGRDFLNPIYQTPARQMVAFVVPRVNPEDIIYSDWDSGFDYYYRQTQMPALSFTDAGAAASYLAGGRAPRVWLVVLGRDQSERSVAASTALREWLGMHYTPAGSWGFVPLNETYRRIKSALLARAAHEYRATVELYVR